MRDIVHELSSAFEIVENDRVVNLNFWEWLNFDHCFSNNPESSFMSHYNVVDIRSTAKSAGVHLPLENSGWRHDLDLEYDVLDISISIFFHS